MLRYRLRTLLILLAILPPLLWIGWGKYQSWKAEQERLKALREAEVIEALRRATSYYPQPPNTSYIPAPKLLPPDRPPDSSDLEHGKRP